ncbi:MAG: alpha/beta fold hydrolase, partial [bacterium]|nr:alpha/beta fold hydrolase [bacterium]
TGYGGFSEPPEQLPANLTVNAIGPIDTAGVHLASFLTYLQAEFGIGSIDLVGHSMGGLFSRAAIGELARRGSTLRVRSLTTIGTPWQGSFPADYSNGDISLAAARAHPSTAAIMVEFKKRVEAEAPGASAQVTRRFLTEAGGWNDRQAGVLDDIAVTLIGGDHFRSTGGSPDVWPHDGLVTISSALAAAVPRAILRPSPALTFNDVHSLFFAHEFGLANHKALTWDPEVHHAVAAAIGNTEISG